MEPEHTAVRNLQSSGRQFSIRDLLVLTLVVSLALTIAVLSRGSHYFGAFAAVWTWASLGIIAAVWFIYRRMTAPLGLFTRRSLAFYAASLLLPSLLVRTDIMFGFSAWLQSYVFGYGCVAEFLFPSPPPLPNIFNFRIDPRLPFSCLIGGVANTFVILSWMLIFTARWRRRPIPRVARRMVWSAFILMFGCLVPITLAEELPILLPGFGLWAASALVLALGLRRENVAAGAAPNPPSTG